LVLIREKQRVYYGGKKLDKFKLQGVKAEIKAHGECSYVDGPNLWQSSKEIY
jgi:hypothetical protein